LKSQQLLPVLRALRKFLAREDFPENLQAFTDRLYESINSRVKALVDNQRLRICTLLDPRSGSLKKCGQHVHGHVVRTTCPRTTESVDKDNVVSINGPGHVVRTTLFGYRVRIPIDKYFLNGLLMIFNEK
jgi:hypothetical protein